MQTCIQRDISRTRGREVSEQAVKYMVLGVIVVLNAVPQRQSIHRKWISVICIQNVLSIIQSPLWCPDRQLAKQVFHCSLACIWAIWTATLTLPPMMSRPNETRSLTFSVWCSLTCCCCCPLHVLCAPSPLSFGTVPFWTNTHKHECRLARTCMQYQPHSDGGERQGKTRFMKTFHFSSTGKAHFGYFILYLLYIS